MLQVNEANEGVNKIKWSSSPGEWEMNQIDNENEKKEKHRNAFVNNESWMSNDERWRMKDEWQMKNNERQMMDHEGWMTISQHCQMYG